MNHRWKLFGAPALVGLGVLLLWLPPQLVQWSGYQALTARAEAVVDEATLRNLGTFALISFMKNGVDIVEGSSIQAKAEAGAVVAGGSIGVDVEVGDAVQSVYDAIDFVWEALLYTLMLLSTYKVLLQTGLSLLGFQVAGAGCLVWGLGLLSARIPESLRLTAQRVALAGVVCGVALPLGLLGMQWTSAHYTSGVKARQETQMAELKQRVEVLTGQMGELKDSIDVLHPSDSLNAIRKKINDVATTISSTVTQGLTLMLGYVALWLLELLVFPILTAYAVLRMLRWIVGAPPAVRAATKPTLAPSAQA